MCLQLLENLLWNNRVIWRLSFTSRSTGCIICVSKQGLAVAYVLPWQLVGKVVIWTRVHNCPHRSNEEADLPNRKGAASKLHINQWLFTDQMKILPLINGQISRPVAWVCLCKSDLNVQAMFLLSAFVLTAILMDWFFRIDVVEPCYSTWDSVCCFSSSCIITSCISTWQFHFTYSLRLPEAYLTYARVLAQAINLRDSGQVRTGNVLIQSLTESFWLIKVVPLKDCITPDVMAQKHTSSVGYIGIRITAMLAQPVFNLTPAGVVQLPLYCTQLHKLL